MCSSSEIGLYGIVVCFDLVLKLVERLEGGFAMDGSEFSLLEKGVLVVNVSCHGGWRR